MIAILLIIIVMIWTSRWPSKSGGAIVEGQLLAWIHKDDHAEEVQRWAERLHQNWLWSWSWAVVVLYWRVYVMLCAAQCSGMRPRQPGPWRTGRGGTWIQIQSSGITPACDELASRATPMPRESSSDPAHFLQELLDARWTTMVEFIDQEKNIVSGFDCCSLFSPVAFLCFTVAYDSKY